MAVFNRFNNFNLDLAHKVHNLGSDALKVYLSNSTPNIALHTVKADLSEIAAGNGYTAGGASATVLSSSQTNGVYRLILNDPLTWVATGSGFGPFRWAVLYNSTATNNPLIGYWEYPITISNVNASETFKLDLDQTTGVIIIQ